MDMSQIQARITELEARRARGESVPELDVLYKRMDAMTNQGYRTATGEDKKTFAPSGTPVSYTHLTLPTILRV